MAFRVEFSEHADVDLDDILLYISDELCAPQAAERFYLAVFDKLDFLCENPYMYPLHHNETLKAKGFRFIVISNYLLFYIINDIKNIVTIIRILYGKRDFNTAFDSENTAELF